MGWGGRLRNPNRTSRRRCFFVSAAQSRPTPTRPPRSFPLSWIARSIAATLSSPRGELDSDSDEPEPEPASAGSGAGPVAGAPSPRSPARRAAASRTTSPSSPRPSPAASEASRRSWRRPRHRRRPQPRAPAPPQGEIDEGEPVPGVTEEGQIDEGEPVVFVRHISTWPEKWFDLPLFTSERHADGADDTATLDKVMDSLTSLANAHGGDHDAGKETELALKIGNINYCETGDTVDKRGPKVILGAGIVCRPAAEFLTSYPNICSYAVDDNKTDQIHVIVAMMQKRLFLQ